MNAIHHLLASDMDGTVIPLDDKPERGEEIAHFANAFRERKDLALAYATGRDLQRVLRGIELSVENAAFAILIAVASNTVAKAGWAWIAGGRQSGLIMLAVAILAIAAGILGFQLARPWDTALVR